MKDEDAPVPLNRRNLLKGASLAGAAALSAPIVASAQSASASDAKTSTQIASDAAGASSAQAHASGAKCGSDFMVDVMQSLKLDLVAANPGSSFRGLHESILNYGMNRAPEFITCMHEESSVGMAHGYAKVTGRPLTILAHSTVGLQHASMALYNAWCDRVPVIAIIGNIMNATERRPGIEWYHTAQDPAAMVRDFVKWDDQPASLQHFGESLVRAHKIAMTPPMGPVVISADGGLQEMSLKGVDKLHIPKLSVTTPPQGDENAVREAAKLLAAAEHPVIVAERLARTANGMTLLVQLAELLGAPVVDQGGRMNFPNTHALSQNERGGGLIRGADVILALEVADLWGTVHEYVDNEERTVSSKIRAGTKVISITSGDLYLKSNYQDFQRYAEADIAMAADGEATLPALIEAVRSRLDDAGRRRVAARTQELTTAKAKARADSRTAAAVAWDASPVSTARLSTEVWAAIRGENWSLVSSDGSVSGWPHRLWTFDRYDQYIGGAGGGGVGYGLPAAVGAALAFRGSGKIAVNIQSDGDLMYAPGALWTAVHHKLPLLSVMHNNRAYHQEIMHIQRMANHRERGVDTAHIGTTITNPFIDYAQLARSMGMWAEGPVSDPHAVAAALKRALEVVKRGEPALVDVVTQPR